jgi:hypothetical protein
MIRLCLGTNRSIDDFFEKFVNIKALARPSERTHADLHNWMIFNRPLLEGEDDFIYHISDLVSSKRTNEYSSQQGNRLDDFIRTCLVGKPGSFIDVCIWNPEKPCQVSSKS